MYVLIAVDDEEVKQAKRVDKNAVKNVEHKKFVDVLFNKKMIRHNMKKIQSKFLGAIKTI